MAALPASLFPPTPRQSADNLPGRGPKGLIPARPRAPLRARARHCHLDITPTDSEVHAGTLGFAGVGPGAREDSSSPRNSLVSCKPVVSLGLGTGPGLSGSGPGPNGLRAGIPRWRRPGPAWHRQRARPAKLISRVGPASDSVAVARPGPESGHCDGRWHCLAVPQA